MIKRRRTLSRMLHGDWGPGNYMMYFSRPAFLARVILPDGTEAAADMVKVVVKSDGSVRTSYPFSSAYPTMPSRSFNAHVQEENSSNERDSSHDREPCRASGPAFAGPVSPRTGNTRSRTQIG